MTSRLVFVSPKNPANGFQFQQQQQQQKPHSATKSAAISPLPKHVPLLIQPSTSMIEMFPPVGLVNTGATCFFNASLQCLFACPSFVSLLLSCNTQAKVERDILDLLSLHLTSHVRKLHSQSNKRNAIPIHAIFKLLRQQSNGLIRTGRQEDSHEALVMLFDQMEKALLRANPGKYTPAVNPVNDVFGCTLNRHILCPACKYESKHAEPNVVLSVEMKSGKSSAQQLIRNALASTTMDKDNKWECGGCKKRVQAETFYSFASFPETLILHLKRFAINRMGREEKLKTPFSIEGSEELEFGDVRYELVGVLVHQGSRTSSGHYYSFVRINKVWYEVDDEIVKRVSSQTVARETQAYMLFYSRKPQEGKAVLALGRLQQLHHERPSPAAGGAAKAEEFAEKRAKLETPPTPTPAPPSKPVVLDTAAPEAAAVLVKNKMLAEFTKNVQSPVHSIATSVTTLGSMPPPPRIDRAVLGKFATIANFRGSASKLWKAVKRNIGVMRATGTYRKASNNSSFASPKRRPTSPPSKMVAFVNLPPPPPASPPKDPLPPPPPPKVQTPPQPAVAVVPPASAMSMESFLPTQFSFDRKTPKRQDFGDAWDEHLDKGRTKKVKVMRY